MAGRNNDLRDCPSAYECRDRLPALSAWMSGDDLKQLLIWKGDRFESGQQYFDLDNPDRGMIAATGDEGSPANYTYVVRSEVPEEVWAKLITWGQPMDAAQGEAISDTVAALGTPPERSAAGDFRPPPSRR